jgi:hypothetical protein
MQALGQVLAVRAFVVAAIFLVAAGYVTFAGFCPIGDLLHAPGQGVSK